MHTGRLDIEGVVRNVGDSVQSKNSLTVFIFLDP